MSENHSEHKPKKKNKCPYCQSLIKDEAGTIFCSDCGTPHHIECWQENGGCTTYGCKENPVTLPEVEESNEIKGIDVGDRTVEELSRIIKPEIKVTHEEIDCKYCSKKIDSNSKFCKHCGEKLTEDITSSSFEAEYKDRYKENISIKKKSRLLTIFSITALSIFIVLILYFSYKLINENLVGEKSKVREITKNWSEAYQKRDVEKIRVLLDKDYLYYDKNNKTADAQARIKLLSAFFKSNKYKNCVILNIKTEPDSASSYHTFLTFDQVFSFDKETRTEKRSFKLYRSEEPNSKWKIFREYAQSEQ